MFVSSTTDLNFRVTDLEQKVKHSKDFWPTPHFPRLSLNL